VFITAYSVIKSHSQIDSPTKMKLNTTIAILSLAAAISAAPAADPAPETDLIQRANNGAYCKSWHGTDWGFTIETWGKWGSDWGRGLLDNLRGQCGSILRWKFEYGSNGNGYASFNTYGGIRAHCVEDAIWLASSGSGAIENVQCQQQ
jgi:hypothetical protein